MTDLRKVPSILRLAPFDAVIPLDATDYRILAELHGDGRITMAELARRVALSAPAVAERVRRLEHAGIITGYTARINPLKLGLHLHSFIRLSSYGLRPGGGPQLASRLEEMPEILEFHVVTGDDCGIMRVVARDTDHLQDVLERLAPLGKTATSVILSSPIVDRAVLPARSEAHG